MSRRRSISVGQEVVHFAGQDEKDRRLPGEADSVNRGTPFGSSDWVVRTAEQLGLGATLRPRGRPKKESTDSQEK